MPIFLLQRSSSNNVPVSAHPAGLIQWNVTRHHCLPSFVLCG